MSVSMRWCGYVRISTPRTMTAGQLCTMSVAVCDYQCDVIIVTFDLQAVIQGQGVCVVRLIRLHADTMLMDNLQKKAIDLADEEHRKLCIDTTNEVIRSLKISGFQI